MTSSRHLNPGISVMMILKLDDAGQLILRFGPYVGIRDGPGKSKKVIYGGVIGWVRPAWKGGATGPVDIDYRA
jgi:hypothetical protein